MNIQIRFLQKAIEDKNYISFKYEGKNHKQIKPLSLKDQELLHTDKGTFEFSKVQKFVVLKERF